MYFLFLLKMENKYLKYSHVFFFDKYLFFIEKVLLLRMKICSFFFCVSVLNNQYSGIFLIYN